MSQLKKVGGLRFWDLVCFNQAMLVKQGWQLLLYDDLLVSKVLRARYFWRSPFLHVELGSNPSNIWWSILWERDLLKWGFRWCMEMVGVLMFMTVIGCHDLVLSGLSH